MGSKTVDIIIPCYNGATYLPQTIESALGQVYSPVSILVVDDGSTDASREIVKSYGERVVYFFKGNGGQASARNAGITRTQGDYVCLLDADDIILPEMIRDMVNYLDQHPEVDIYHSKTLAFNNFNILHPYAECWRPFRVWDCYLEPLSLLCAIHGSSAIFRRRAFENFGLFPEDRAIQGCEDWHFWLQSVLQGAVIKYCPIAYTLYRQHPSSSSSQERNIALRESELMRRAVKLFRLHGITEDRKWLLLSYGLKSVALRWSPLGEAVQYHSLVELSRAIAPVQKSDRLEIVFGNPDNVPISVLYLYLCRAFIEMGLPDLAAIMFLRSGDGRSLKREAERAGVGELFEFAVETMAGFIPDDLHRTRNEHPGTPNADDRGWPHQSEGSPWMGLSKGVPQDASFWGYVEHQLGLLNKSEGALDEAEARFRQAIRQNPNFGYSRLELISILNKKGHYKQAAREIRQAVALDPESVVSFAIDRVCRSAENRSTALGTMLNRLRKSNAYQRFTRIVRDTAAAGIKSLAGRGRAR